MRHVGVGTHIDDTAVIESRDFYIGDYCYIGPNVKIMADVFCMGDYSKLHDRVWIYTQSRIFPGHSKRGTEAEVAFMKHLVSYKSRFTPHNQGILDIHASLEPLCGDNTRRM